MIVGAAPELAAALAAHVAAASAAAVAARGSFAIALSGGSCPRSSTLAAEPPFGRRVGPLGHALADERCVPADDADSNFKAVDDALLKAPRPGSPRHTLDGALSPPRLAAPARDYEAKLLAATGGTGTASTSRCSASAPTATGSLGHALVAAPPPPPATGAPPPALVAVADCPSRRRAAADAHAERARARACAFVGTGAGRAPILAQAFETALGPEPAADPAAPAAPAPHRYREPPRSRGMVRRRRARSFGSSPRTPRRSSRGACGLPRRRPHQHRRRAAARTRVGLPGRPPRGGGTSTGGERRPGRRPRELSGAGVAMVGQTTR